MCLFLMDISVRPLHANFKYNSFGVVKYNAYPKNTAFSFTVKLKNNHWLHKSYCLSRNESKNQLQTAHFLWKAFIKCVFGFFIIFFRNKIIYTVNPVMKLTLWFWSRNFFKCRQCNLTILLLYPLEKRMWLFHWKKTHNNLEFLFLNWMKLDLCTWFWWRGWKWEYLQTGR